MQQNRCTDKFECTYTQTRSISRFSSCILTTKFSVFPSIVIDNITINNINAVINRIKYSEYYKIAKIS